MKKCGNDEAKFESILRSHNIDLFNVLNKNLVDLPAIKMIHNISPEMHQHISPAPDVRQIYTEYIEDFSQSFANCGTDYQSKQFSRSRQSQRISIQEETKEIHLERSLEVWNVSQRDWEGYEEEKKYVDNKQTRMATSAYEDKGYDRDDKVECYICTSVFKLSKTFEVVPGFHS